MGLRIHSLKILWCSHKDFHQSMFGHFITLCMKELRKEINRLLSKGISNIYLRVTIETFSKLQFSEFKKICHHVRFWGSPTHRGITEF